MSENERLRNALATLIAEFYNALSWVPPKRRDPFFPVIREAEAVLRRPAANPDEDPGGETP
jgi:hypothetical protein